MRFRLLFFGYPLAEILAAWLVAQLIGWGWTLVLLLAGIPLGFAVMRRAGGAAFASLRAATRSGGLPGGEAGTHSLTFFAGLLIAIPGFCTDIVGLLVLTPPVKEFLRRRVARRISVSGLAGAATFPGTEPSQPYFGGGDVVVGEVVDPEKPHGTNQIGPSKEGPI